jgi:DNA-binding NarL/FixJ family response regulator
MNIRIAVVEDDAELRMHFTEMLGMISDFSCVGSFASAEAFEAEFDTIQPDVVLMDINLPGKTGIDCIMRCKPLNQKIQYLVCTVFEDSDNLFKALMAGATGYILKISDLEVTEKAIREIYAGGSPMSPQIARYVINALPGNRNNNSALESLSKREIEILELLAAGYRYKEIADKLFLGVNTVRTYIRNIYSTLQVHSRTDALNKAFGK